VVGGIQIDEPAADLAVALQLHPHGKMFHPCRRGVDRGNGLAGECVCRVRCRRVCVKQPTRFQMRDRAKSDSQPHSGGLARLAQGIEIIEARSVSQALDAAFAVQREILKVARIA